MQTIYIGTYEIEVNDTEDIVSIYSEDGEGGEFSKKEFIGTIERFTNERI